MEDGEHDDADRRAVTKELDQVSVARQAGRLEIHGAAFFVLSGTDVGRAIPLDVDEMTIGRDAVCHVYLPDEGVSRRHARLRFLTDRSWQIDDLGSANGTVINGERMASRVLRDGDRVLIGHTVLKFCAQAQVDEEYQERSFELSVWDALPQVRSRRFFEDRLRVEVAYARRHQTLVSLLLVDIDRLQAVNDAHGREAGTEVLRQVAASMQGRIRAEDLLVRWRGEEFAILVRGIPPEGAFVLAERVRRGIEGLTVKHEANDIRVTMTIGAATVAGSPDLTGAALVEAAEGLLREAKASGPNRTCARMVVVGPAEAEARKDRTTEV